jgi:hypothetical protein
MNHLLLAWFCLSGAAPANVPLGAPRAYYAFEINGVRELPSGPHWEYCFRQEGPREAVMLLTDAEGKVLGTGSPINVEVRTKPMADSVRADLDGNGIVGISDLGVFVKAFGLCNENLQEATCK